MMVELEPPPSLPSQACLVWEVHVERVKVWEVRYAIVEPSASVWVAEAKAESKTRESRMEVIQRQGENKCPVYHS